MTELSVMLPPSEISDVLARQTVAEIPQIILVAGILKPKSETARYSVVRYRGLKPAAGVSNHQ
jgi:hypothetical protein